MSSEKWDAWVKANLDRLPRRMPLSAFMRELPNWALADITGDTDTGEPSNVAVHAAIVHESLWQDGESIRFSNSLPTCMVMVGVLEIQRRYGISRWIIEGDDRLTNSNELVVEMNPSVTHLLEDTTIDTAEFLRKAIALTIASDWCDVALLRAP